MSTATIASFVLGGGGLLTAAYTVYTNFRDRGRIVQQQEGSISLDKSTRRKIAADAAKINSDERIETERWWKEQFDAVKVELGEEQKWRRGITKYIRAHQPWDVLVQAKLTEHQIDFPDPPTLEFDFENGK